MTELYLSTVHRMAPLATGGDIVHVDWDSKRELHRAPIILDNPALEDPNPRGNTRGGRGIQVVGDEVVVASYHTLQVFSRSLVHQRDITHPLMVGLHELHPGPVPGSIWSTSTSIDAALAHCLGDGSVIDERWPREHPGLQKRFGVEPLVLDKGVDNRGAHLTIEPNHHVHLNAVAHTTNGLIGLLNQPGAIVDLDHGEVVVSDPMLKRAHNLETQDDLAFVSASHHRAVLVVDLRRRAIVERIDLRRFPFVRRLAAIARPYQLARHAASHVRKLAGRGRTDTAAALFVRGLHVEGDRLWVGLSPCSVLEIDWRKRRERGGLRLSNDPRHTVHGLRVTGV